MTSETRLLEDAITALKATGDEEIRNWPAPYSVRFVVRNPGETHALTLHSITSSRNIEYRKERLEA